ncbi:MAG: hypothetical protein Q8K78_01325 [Planctomycetaceae bacterium]|nr:hypothetical protein [Planctomycetaceae bacterium]
MNPSRITFAILLAASFVGCETLHQAGVPGLEQYVKDEDALAAPEYRESFQVDRDPTAFSWLLAHRVRNGMTVSEVSEALGDSGEEFSNSQALKKNANEYQATDIAYRWGPDAQGRSVILFFRDGHLIQFNPRDFGGQ